MEQVHVSLSLILQTANLLRMYRNGKPRSMINWGKFRRLSWQTRWVNLSTIYRTSENKISGVFRLLIEVCRMVLNPCLQISTIGKLASKF